MKEYVAWEDVASVRQILAEEKGLHEERGQNDGTCEQYQRAIGGDEAVDRHDSWCLYFVLWGYLQVFGTLGVLRQLVPAITGSCEQFRQAARKTGRLMPIGTAPLPGDIGLVVAGDAPGHAHHAFFVATRAPESAGAGITTIEGNSNNTGGSNGDGAYVRDKRWGPTDPCTHGGTNHYELVRLTDPAIPCPD